MEQINIAVSKGIYYSISVQTKLSAEDLCLYIICANIQVFSVPALSNILIQFRTPDRITIKDKNKEFGVLYISFCFLLNIICADIQVFSMPALSNILFQFSTTDCITFNDKNKEFGVLYINFCVLLTIIRLFLMFPLLHSFSADYKSEVRLW